MEVRVRVISSRALWASLPRFTAGKKKMLVESDKLTWLTQLRVEEGWVGLTREYSGSCVRVDRSKGRDDIYEVS